MIVPGTIVAPVVPDLLLTLGIIPVVPAVVPVQPNCGKHGNEDDEPLAEFAGCWFCSADRPNNPQRLACGAVATPARMALHNIEAMGPIICAFAIAAIIGRNPASITATITPAAVRE